MSLVSLNDNAEFVQFKIKDSDLTQFYKTNCGQEFASKALSINNIHFQAYIYPNGRRKEHFGYIQFLVALTSFESNIKSISVCCKLYCPELHVMHKEVHKLHKVGDMMRWSPFQVDIYQYQHVNNLNFWCHIELLRKKEKRVRKISLHSMRRESSLSLTSVENVLQPQSFQVKTHVDILWTMSYKIIYLLSTANNSASFCTKTINNMWSLCILPKGMKQKDDDYVVFVLKLMRLPPEIRSIEVYIEIQSEKNNFVERRRDVLFSYDKTQEVFKLPFSTSLLNTMRTFKLKAMVKITKIYEDIGSKQKGRLIENSWSIFWFDQFQRDTVNCHDIDYGQYNIAMDPNDIDTDKNNNALNNKKLIRSLSWTNGGSYIMDHTLNDDEEKERSNSSHMLKTASASNSWLTLPLVPSSTRLTSNSVTSYHRISVSSAPNVELMDIKEDVAMKKDKIKWPLSLRSKLSNKTPKQNKVKPENNSHPTVSHTANSDIPSTPNEIYDHDMVVIKDANLIRWPHALTLRSNSSSNKTPKQNKVKPELWNHISNEDQDSHSQHEEHNIFFEKFKQWLCVDLVKPMYLEAFQSKRGADVRLIKHFTDEDLINVGVDEWDRKIILDEANAYKLAQQKLDTFINSHFVLRSFESCLKHKGIFTIHDLESIPDEEALQMILNIPPDDERLAEIWCIIHPSRCGLQSEVNELQKKHKEAMDAMDLFLHSYIKLQEKISTEQSNDQMLHMEQQQIDMQKKYCARLKQHQSLLQRSRDISRYKSESGLLLNETVSSPSHTEKSHGLNIGAINLMPDVLIHQLSDTQITANVRRYNSSTSRTASSGIPSTSSEIYDNSHRCSGDQDMEKIKEKENSDDSQKKQVNH